VSVEAPPFSIVQRLSGSIEDFIRRLVAVAGFFPAIVATSWWRSPSNNAAVGGHPRSQHLLGLAVDVVLPPSERADFVALCEYVGLVAIDEGTHVHVQRFPAGTVGEHQLAA
jgi:hypothetical protein